MQIGINVEGKVVGQQGSAFGPRVVEIEGPESINTLSLRDLIIRLVSAEVEAFHNRQEDRRLLHVMTGNDIAASRLKGEFDFGAHPVQTVDGRLAIKTALQAFEDGLYYVFIDGDQCEELDGPVVLTATSQLRLLRLIPLAGG